MKSKDRYRAIGVMSGTSMDGLDIACCRFTKKRKWEFEIQAAVTLPYSTYWKDKLSHAHEFSSEALLALDSDYGRFIGESCVGFIRKEKIKKVDLIASHGHTIFHQPNHRFTFQLGNGNTIHSATTIPVIYDFRSLDINLGGQGAPLVPVGDRYLFDRYEVCLNLGGIANLSTEKDGKRIAFDICYANMGLNYLAGKTGKIFDHDGALALNGSVEAALLAELRHSYDHLRKSRPALAREGFESDMARLLDQQSIPLNNRMRTFCESIAIEIREAIPEKKAKQKLLATGGGVLNPVLMKILAEKLADIADITIPPRRILEFKEAMVFAFLGVLRARGEVNVLKSVTRALSDSCSGVIAGKIA